jgi:DNA-binding LacI/PurR family transcriptional regulator
MGKPAKRATTRDVAALAGVSQPTVSLVLSGNPRARVASDTRARVLDAARQLGYQPNLLARGLVSRRSYAIGVIVPDLDNPFFTEVVSGAERVAAQEGYAVLLCDARGADLERHLHTLTARQVDGIILDAGAAAKLDKSDRLVGQNIVLVDELSGRWPGVATDAPAAGRLAAEHLLALGHRRLAFVGPATESYGFRMRERGFVAALRERGVSLGSERLRRAPASVAGGMAAMRELLALPETPTAVFCANDLVAIGALKVCLNAGVRVPEQLSIVGCDDIEMARVVTPELTTVMVPARGLGARAARLLLERLSGSPQRTRRTGAKPLPVELVVRGTTARAPERD